jgi:outer membrane protein
LKTFIHKLASALAIAAASLGLALPAQAEDLKIGVVNVERVLKEATIAKAADAKLGAEVAKREKELADMAGRLKAGADKLDKEAPTLSEADRNRRQRELVDQEREFQRKRREVQEDLTLRKNEELAALQERAARVIKQIAETEKFDLIIEGGVYWSARIDITKKVIDALNAAK